MPLNDTEIKWLESLGDTPVSDDDMRKADARESEREQFLDTAVRQMLDQQRGDIDRVMKSVRITNVSEARALQAIWLKVCGKDTTVSQTMDWRADEGDVDRGLGSGFRNKMDVEVDTKEDIGENTQEIPPEQVMALHDALAGILQSQQEMLDAFDEDGNRLFSDDDIRRELWTPLVRSGLIPENMVPDKFSEEAKAFRGAVEIYGDKLKDFSKKSTGREDLLKGLNIAKDVVTVVGTVVVSTVGMSHAMQIAANTEHLRTGFDASGDPLSKDAIASLKIETAGLQEQDKLTSFAAAVGVGGLELVVAGVDASTRKSDAGRWAGVVDKTFEVMTRLIALAVDPMTRIGNQDDIATGTDKGKAAVNYATLVSSALTAALNGARFLPTLYMIGKEPDEAKRLELISGLVGKLGACVGSSLDAYAAEVKKTDPTAASELSQIGAATKSAITKLANVPMIYDALKKGHPDRAAMLLGGGAIQLVIGGSSEALYDVVRADVTSDDSKKSSFESSPYKETVGTSQESTQNLGSAKTIQDLEQAMAGIDKALIGKLAARKAPVMDGTAAEALQRKATQELQDKDKDEARKKLAEHFKDPEAVEQMFAEFDKKMIGYDQMYADANPRADMDDLPPTEAEAALEAIDKAIARTAELRGRVELLNAVTAGTVGVIASFVPGVGAVAAAQKVAFDIYALIRNVDMHNKWCDSMEIAFRAGSAYTAAVERTMLGARITMSRTSVKLVLDSLQMGAQIGRCFDPTGGATVASTALTLTQALVDFGYRMATEMEIKVAWDSYKDALANPGNRKRARNAMRLNSTLAKCAIAYGACMADEPIAKEAIRLSGLSPEILADDKDVCKKLVSYLENELNQDPQILKVQKSARAWYPAERPLLTPGSWSAYKAAAMKQAVPPLARPCGKTPGIDWALLGLAGQDCWRGESSYAQAHAIVQTEAFAGRAEGDVQGVVDVDVAVRRLAVRSQELLERLKVALSGYRPVVAGPKGDKEAAHKDMGDIVKTLTQLCEINLATVRRDLAMPVVTLPPLVEANDEDKDV